MYEYRALTEEETEQYLNGTRVFPGARETEHGVEVPWDCDCSEDFGPCEDHLEVLAQREGAAARTGDDLVYVFLTDVLACAEDSDTRQGADVDTRRLRDALIYWEDDSRWDDNMGCRWVKEDEPAEIADDIHAGESVLADLGLCVWWDDGYVIGRVTSGPLAE